jgi:glutathione peroxidase-family protein
MQSGIFTTIRQVRSVMTRSQFGGQEPEDDPGIATFCERNHGVTFPLMAKSDVNGDDASEVYKYLKAQKSGLLGLTRIKVCSTIRRLRADLTSP